jgi:universal stress protein E
VTAPDDHTIHALLVAGDAREPLLQAVAKAATIEHYTGAAVSVLLTMYDPIADEGTEWFNQADTEQIIENLRRTELDALESALVPWRKRMADLTVDVVFQRDGAAAIEAVARARKADFILKPLARTGRVADFLHAPLDWQLMRDAPCPVLFTRAGEWHKPVRVLAAVDAADTAHASLNRTILLRAELLRAVLDGELHVVSAYPSLGQQTSQYQVANDFAALKKEMQARRTANVARLLAETGVRAAATHVLEGRPRTVIPALAARIDAGLTVLGTAARKGLKKLLIGNTAEGIASDLGTDLLTVREAGAH